MRIIAFLVIFLSANCMADGMAGIGYEYISGIEKESDGNTGLIKLSYMNQIAEPFFIGGDLAFNVEQLIFDDIRSRRYEHEAYLNLNFGVLNRIGDIMVGYAYVGGNAASLERDLPNGIYDEEDVKLEGKVIGVGMGIRCAEQLYLNVTLSRIENSEGFLFTGGSISLNAVSF